MHPQFCKKIVETVVGLYNIPVFYVTLKRICLLGQIALLSELSYTSVHFFMQTKIYWISYINSSVFFWDLALEITKLFVTNIP